MGFYDSSLLHLIQKFKSLIFFNSNSVPCGLETMDKNGWKWSGKVYPSESPLQGPETPSPSFSGDSQNVHTQSSNQLSSNYSSPDSVLCSTRRNDYDKGEQLTSHFFSAPIEYLNDISDLDSSSVVSSRHEFCNSMSLGSSGRSDGLGLHVSSSQIGIYELNNNPINIDPKQAVLEKPANLQPLDFETNGLIWFPPPPDDSDDEIENKLITYDDEDADVGDFGFMLSPTDDIGTVFSEKEKRDFNQETWRGVVEGHFRTLVSQLLQAEGISITLTDDDCCENWVDIVMAIAWKTAKFLKPNTSRDGSMDPCDYLKVKCLASGNRGESELIRGIVCTKNVKHKRMLSQYKNARLLLLGGSLECQRVPNLASFDTLLQQENDHLKAIVSKIEAHRPNVLIVEKSASSFALEHLLDKEISLVLNVKRPILERIAKCTGASITPSTEHISATKLGHCELFHLEKVSEEHEPVNQFKKKPTKTLMFFEGCPRRLGCTVILRGSCREELKKVKHVVQYAVFAAYHLSLETSFLADEGAGLPTSPVESLHFSPEEITSSNIDSLSADLDSEFGYKEPMCEVFTENLVDEVMGPTCPVTGNSQTDDAKYISVNDTHQSILVSFSNHCMSSGTVCEQSKLVRLKFYGSSDKPLGRYLSDDLLHQTKKCGSCKESAEAHVVCYTHQHANLTINVKRLPLIKLPGEKDGKIWMWHRCLRCPLEDRVPLATRRVVMSDAAWGLSFGKFLELSFSSHTTGNRVASCGHSLQRDCLRFYGFGSMVAFFRYSPINIHSVCLPPSILEFSCPDGQAWMSDEANELLRKARALHAEVSGFLEEFKIKSSSFVDGFSDANELNDHIMDLIDILSIEKCYYEDLLESPEHDQPAIDIFKMNRMRHSLLISSRDWDCRLYLLDNLFKSFTPKTLIDFDDTVSEYPNESGSLINEGDIIFTSSLERHLSAGSILSDQIDLAWSGSDMASLSNDHSLYMDSQENQRFMSPTRVFSFDSAQMLRCKGLSASSLYLSNLQSFSRHMVSDPVMMVQSMYSQEPLREAELLNITPSYISCVPSLPQGARLMVSHNGENNIVFTVYENEPSSVISYALCSKQYDDGFSRLNFEQFDKFNPGLSTTGSFESDYASYENYAYENVQSNSPHIRISFEDEPSLGGGRMRFSVVCYFAKEFDSLRRKCCKSEMEFVRSLSRCKRWSAQGGKSNVYFAKSFDDRFILKQVTKTELDSFEDFAPKYFKYLTDAVTSGSPTCLAKVLGIYQVTVKNMNAGKEVKMDLMVMENLFFGRNISKVYDLKGSVRSRYNPGVNKVMLDMNLVETLRTNPIFLRSRDKRVMERSVWNDTCFLASVGVMDYSLLVGVDEEGKELVMGIIDFMRQYTWDKHLETWVKASGILGGLKKESPTIVSPKQYKKRFRKAMTSYFLTLPHQWSS